MLAPRRRVQPNPIIPGKATDRTGTGGILRKAVAAIRVRFALLERDLLAAFDRIPVYALNLDLGAPRVRYGLTPDQLASVSEELQAALDRWLTDGRLLKHILWYQPFIDQAHQLGAAQSVTNLSRLSDIYAAARSLEMVVFSEPYRLRVAMSRYQSYEHWTGLAAQTRQDLAGVIGRAVADGLNPKAARALIADKIEVSRGRALGYAQTDITGALREARWAEADDAEASLGIRTGLLWTSAFLPTTRPTHGARHGHTYTTADVRAFYGRDGNRYRCFLPGTRVAGRFIAGVKSRYEGPAARLVTAGGRELSVTANHPVLTTRGMVPAAEIRKGDHLVAYLGNLDSPFRVGALDGGLAGARVEDVFGALVEVGHQFPGRVSAVDLHGDAAFVEPDVDVVYADRELVFALDAAAAQLLDDLALIQADPAASAGSPSNTLGKPNLSHAGDGIGRRDVRLPLLGAHAGHARALAAASIANKQPEVNERLPDGAAFDAGALADREDRLASQVPGAQRSAQLHSALAREGGNPEISPMEGLANSPIAYAEAVGDVLHRLAGLAALDEVSDVVLIQYAGHVFDLQERSGLMLGSAIVASNCHCAQTECLIDDAGKPILSDSLKKAMAGELARWRKSKK